MVHFFQPLFPFIQERWKTKACGKSQKYLIFFVPPKKEEEEQE